MHRVQIEYLQELILNVEDPGLKEKLINRLFKIKQAFVALNDYKEYIESQKDFWDGDVGFSKKAFGKIFNAIHGGAYAGMAGFLFSVVTAADMAAIPIVLGAAGTGAVGRLALDEYQKFRLNKKLNKILKKFVDLHSVSDDEELLSLLDEYSSVEIDQKKQLLNIMGVEEIE